MRLVLREITIDDCRLRRVVELVLDVFDLRDLGQLGDVECAVVKGDPIRAVQALGDDPDLAFAGLVDNGINLVQEPRADEQRALVPLSQRARIGDAAGVDLNPEPVGKLKLIERQLVRGGGNRRRRDRRERRTAGSFGPTLLPGWRWNRLLLGGCGACSQETSDHSGEQQRPPLHANRHCGPPRAEAPTIRPRSAAHSDEGLRHPSIHHFAWERVRSFAAGAPALGKEPTHW